MTPTNTVFCSASDDTLVTLINEARRRLLVVSPALTESVGEALLAKIRGVDATQQASVADSVQISIVLDDGPEAYRLGYGTTANHLAQFRQAADAEQIRFRVESGVRIGVLVSDDRALVFSPTPQLVEEPTSLTLARTNGIWVSAHEVDRLARASGWIASHETAPGDEDGRDAARSSPTTPEVGVEPFALDAVRRVVRDLEDNPPEPFNLSRRIRVFSSRVKYVELNVANAKIGALKVTLPPELLGIVNDDLRGRFDGKLGPPPELLEPFSVEIETAEGRREKQRVDAKWFAAERRRIEDQYTFTVPKYGRLIYGTRWPDFRAETERLERNLKAYHATLIVAAKESRDHLKKTLFREFLPNLLRTPPAHLMRYRNGRNPSREDIRWYLDREIERLVSRIVTIRRPEVRIVRKDVAPESLREQGFIEGLEKRLPPHEIEGLFTDRDAAPSREAASAAYPSSS